MAVTEIDEGSFPTALLPPSGWDLPKAKAPRYVPMAAVGVATFGAFLAFLDSTVVNVAFPNLEASFRHTPLETLSWILNAYNVVFAGLLVLAGRFADLIGRRRLLVAGSMLFGGFSALCAVAPSAGLLITFRVFQGAGAAAMVPASLGVVLHAVPSERRAHALSLWGAAGALAAGLGPPIGGALVELDGWRLVFLINVPLALAGILLARRSIVESRSPGRRVTPDLVGASALSVALAAFTLAIVQSSTWGWVGAGTLVSFAVAGAAAAAAVRSSRGHRSPILDPELLRVRPFAVANVIFVLTGFGLYIYLLTHILFLVTIWHYSVLRAGLAVAPGALVAAAVATPSSKLAERFGPRPVVTTGCLLWAAAYAWYALRVGHRPDFLGQWLPGQVISGIGVGVTLPVTGTGGMAAVPARSYATASAVGSSARQLGGVIGVAVLTTVLAHPTASTLAGDYHRGWEMAGWAFVAAAVVALFFGPRRAAEDQEAASGLRPLVRTSAAEVTSHRSSSRPDVLAGLSPAVRRQVLQATSTLKLPGGEVLFRAGDPADSMYFVRAGRLQVQVAGGASRDIAAGSAFGELALLTGLPRSATVVARRDSTLKVLGRTEFDRLSGEIPDFGVALARHVAAMLQDSRPAHAPDQPPPKLVAVVGISDGAATAAVAVALEDLIADARKVEVTGPLTPSGLQRAEAALDLLLMTAGPGTASDGSPNRGGAGGRSLAEAVLRQADHSILVSGDPEPPHSRPSGLGGRCDVVITGAVPTPAQVVRWTDLTGCRRVYAAGREASTYGTALAPLGRRLSGRSVALVLAGGGARGLAHLGVLAAFEEAGIEVDRISGTSMGAMVAALYASGRSAAEIDQVVFDEFVVGRPFQDWRPSKTSLARGERGRALLLRCFSDQRMECLPRELVVASTDLVDRSPVYHRRGWVAEAVGASMCLPVLFPPQVVDGRVLVDGSLTDNCPVAAWSGPHEGPIVAVRIGGGGTVGGGSSARGRVRVPALGETLMRVMQMADNPRDAEGGPEPTVTVVPDTRGIGLLEFHQIGPARAAGRRAGEAAVRALAKVGALPARRHP